MNSLLSAGKWKSDLYRVKGIVKRAFGPSDAQRDLVMALVEGVDASPGSLVKRVYVRASGPTLDVCFWRTEEDVKEISKDKVLWVETDAGNAQAIRIYDLPDGSQAEEVTDIGVDIRAHIEWVSRA